MLRKRQIRVALFRPDLSGRFHARLGEIRARAQVREPRFAPVAPSLEGLEGPARRVSIEIALFESAGADGTREETVKIDREYILHERASLFG